MGIVHCTVILYTQPLKSEVIAEESSDADIRKQDLQSEQPYLVESKLGLYSSISLNRFLQVVVVRTFRHIRAFK